MRYERKFIVVDKTQISYIELNPEKERAIIFFHGNSNSADLWHQQLSSPMFQSYRLIAVDLPCHGHSEAVVDNCIQAFAELMAQFVVCITNDKPLTLVGISLGGNIVAEMLPLIPLPEGIVIISSAIVGTEITPADIRSTALSETVLFSDQADDKSLMLYFNSVLQSQSPTDIALLIEDYKSTVSTFRGKFLKSIIEQRYSNEINLIRNANIPCLIIVGDRDDVIAPELLQEVKLPLWNNKLHRFDKSGHFINLDQPDEFDDLLHEYMISIHSHV